MGRSNFTIALGRDRDFLAFSGPMTLRCCKKSSDFPAPDQQLSERIDYCEITRSRQSATVAIRIGVPRAKVPWRQFLPSGQNIASGDYLMTSSKSGRLFGLLTGSWCATNRLAYP